MSGHNKRFPLAFSIVSVLIAIFLVATYTSTVFRSALIGFAAPVLHATAQFQEATDTALRYFTTPRTSPEKRAEHYRKTIERLKFRLAHAESSVRENKQLRRQLGLDPPPHWNTIHAQVIARDPLSWNTRFRIDKGRKHGVQEGDAAITNGQYVVGRIQSTTGRTSVVATVTAPSCRLSVRVRGTHGFGILRGPAEAKWYAFPPSIVEYLPPDISYSKGAVVETSGLSLRIPRGLPIGRITGESGDRNTRTIDTIYKEAPMKPFVDLKSIRFVAIVSKGDRPMSGIRKREQDFTENNGHD